jgi:pimeloyl-ACP methyl ester carboxylesterase
MFSADNISRRFCRRRGITFLSLLAATTLACSATSLGAGVARSNSGSAYGVHVWTIQYRTHDRLVRLAYVVLPAWYGPAKHPEIPLVISPHGRGGNGLLNSKLWGDLPARGGFAVVNPDGMGRVLKSYSYGYSGQIDDLARMPSIVQKSLPWLRIDRTRIFALGSSMGGQETLLLVARHPHLLAGAAAMDSVTDLTRRYRQLPQLGCNQRCLQQFGEPYGRVLQGALRREVGGSPGELPSAYLTRSPLALASQISNSRVPLQIWWSRNDHIVFDQDHQSRALFRELRRMDPCGSVSAYVGGWRHSVEMKAHSLLPFALAGFGLLPAPRAALPATVAFLPVPHCSGSK